MRRETADAGLQIQDSRLEIRDSRVESLAGCLISDLANIKCFIA